MDKFKIRKKLLELRLKHKGAERAKKSALIARKLLSLPEFACCKVVCFYVSKEEEVDTLELIRACLKLGKQVVVPLVDSKHKKLLLSELRSLDELVPGTFGILEHKKEFACLVERSSVGLFIVPGVAFDVSGHRIGFGKGFFDKLLHGVRVPVVALAFDFQVLPSIPSSELDVGVGKIVTEKRIVECK
ncbi:5-formyltetrahydrofolate cyclo-ligase [Candidatus Micrarchaeota archaeon]|nr:5-formyltetrahydrofolate cyclo-ligase [Candidatus Micrarchaeota archaeon]